MASWARPRLVVSKCLDFEHCRWDGQMVTSQLVRSLMPHADFIPVCPEVEIGLGVPRRPLRVVSSDGDLSLVQPDNNLDITHEMLGFVGSFLSSLPEVDGFILKSRSPTCAVKDARIFEAGDSVFRSKASGPGFLGGAVLRSFPEVAVEDEGRLRNPRIRSHFLTRIFSLAELRRVEGCGSPEGLQELQSRNELLFGAYDTQLARAMGELAAGHVKEPSTATCALYEQNLRRLMRRPPGCSANIEFLLRAFSHVSAGLSAKERGYFLEEIERYRSGMLPLSVVLGILRSWVIRFEDNYLAAQTLLEPYPRELEDIDTTTAQCEDRDYWH